MPIYYGIFRSRGETVSDDRAEPSFAPQLEDALALTLERPRLVQDIESSFGAQPRHMAAQQ